MRMHQLGLAGLTLAYPLLVYFGLAHLEPRWLALALAAMALARTARGHDRLRHGSAVAAIALACAAWFGNTALPLKLYPVVVNLGLLVLFATSLAHPPSVIERFARLREPALPPSAITYTRRLTQVWCGFFLCNGALAAATALWADDALWALYNGLLAYLLIGALFGGEWLFRRRLRARASDA